MHTITCLCFDIYVCFKRFLYDITVDLYCNPLKSEKCSNHTQEAVHSSLKPGTIFYELQYAMYLLIILYILFFVCHV